MRIPLEDTGFQLPSWTNDFLSSKKNPLSNETEALKLAVELAQVNVEQKSGGPFGAVVYSLTNFEIISIGVNLVVPQNCSIFHGEAVAIFLAQRGSIRNFSLKNSPFGPLALATSGQPCVQCVGMIYWSGLSKLVYAGTAKDAVEIGGFDEGPIASNWREELKGKGCEVLQGGFQEEVRALYTKYKASSLIYNP